MFRPSAVSSIEAAIAESPIYQEPPICDISGWTPFRELEDLEVQTFNPDWQPDPGAIIVEESAMLVELLKDQSLFTGQQCSQAFIDITIRHESEHAIRSRQLGPTSVAFGIGLYRTPHPAYPEDYQPHLGSIFCIARDFTTTKLGIASTAAEPSLLHPSEASTYGSRDLLYIQAIGYESFDDVARRAYEAGI